MTPNIQKNRMHALGATALLLFLFAARGAASDTVPLDTASNSAQDRSTQTTGGMLVRISEIEIHASYLDLYKEILKKEAAASVRLEPGVISIFPMYRKDAPTEIRILEIYASREAYQSHIKSPHFEVYKTTTLKMVKSLKLVDMEIIDPATMGALFKKM